MSYFLNFLSNILFLTGGGGIILLVIVPDRYTAKNRKIMSAEDGAGLERRVG